MNTPVQDHPTDQLWAGVRQALASSSDKEKEIGRRRYGWRSDTSTSSRSSRSSSVSSGFLERFSSSSSENLPEHLAQHIRTQKAVELMESENRSGGWNVFSTLAATCKAERSFQRLLCPPKANEFPVWQGNSEPSTKLVKIIKTRTNGETIVLRRFAKSSRRLRDGLAGLLLASDREVNINEVLDESTNTGQLLLLLINHTNIFFNALPAFLASEAQGGAVGVRFLLRSTRNSRVWSRADVVGMSGFLDRLSESDDRRFCSSIRLKEYLARHHSGLIEGFLGTKLRRFDISELISPEDYATSSRSAPERLAMIQDLLAVFGTSSLLKSSYGMEERRYWLQLLVIVVTKQGVSRESRGATALPLERCLALATLMRLLQTEGALDAIAAHVDELFAICWEVMLGRTTWQFEFEEDRIKADAPKLFPHEDAYDIIRQLPIEKLTTAMAALFEETYGAKDKHAPFRLLEPLLWLSRMPHPHVRGAILAAGVFAFLHSIAAIPVPELQQPDYRLIYRSKGDAITCIGNFIEAMDDEDWSRFKPSPDLLEIINETVKDEELPRTVRFNAAFAVERYGAASLKWDSPSRPAVEKARPA